MECGEGGTFAKNARVPLLSSSYRPISILPAMSKVWEHTCKILIEKCLGRDPFHREQCRFRRCRSTLDALGRVCGIADLCRKRGLVCVLVALDVKNAFNTLSWRRILAEVEERRLPGQLQRLLDSYLSDRKIVVHCRDGEVRRYVYAGVPQGIVIGPLLWNLVYDGLLKVLDLVKDVDVIAFADDLALVITMRKTQDIRVRVRETVKLVTDWCTDTKSTRWRHTQSTRSRRSVLYNRNLREN